jgi:STIMATE family
MFLRIQDHLAAKYNLTTILHTGVYTGPTACKHWTHQTTCWVFILTVVKIIIYFFMVIFSGMLAFVGTILFFPLQFNIRFELLFVMIFFPGFLNVIYFWIADSYLKAKDDAHGAFEQRPDKEMSLISPEEKVAQERADSDMAAMAEQRQQQGLDQTSWERHTEFIATYLPSWSVFGSQTKLEEDDSTLNTHDTRTSASANAGVTV